MSKGEGGECRKGREGHEAKGEVGDEKAQERDEGGGEFVSDDDVPCGIFPCDATERQLRNAWLRHPFTCHKSSGDAGETLHERIGPHVTVTGASKAAEQPVLHFFHLAAGQRRLMTLEQMY